jgi:hypothetical protein
MFLMAVVPLNHFVHTVLISRPAVFRNVTLRTVWVSCLGEMRYVLHFSLSTTWRLMINYKAWSLYLLRKSHQ